MVDLTWTHPALAAPILAQVRACERLLAITDALPSADDAAPIATPGSAEQRMQAVFEEFARTTKTFRAAVQLASTGFGPQVHMLGAVIFESALTVMWGCEHEELASDYAELHAEYGRAQYEARCEFARDGTSSATPFERADEAAAVFGPHSDGSLWTGHRSVEDLVEDLAATQSDPVAGRSLRMFYETNYGWAARQLSASGLANQSHREVIEERKIWAAQLGPSASQVASGLQFASEAYRIAAETLADKYFPEIKKDLRRATAFLWISRRDPSLLASLRDDSPCPCQTPDAQWGSCHKWTSELGTYQHTPLRDSDVSMPAMPDAAEDVQPAEQVESVDVRAERAPDHPAAYEEPTGPVYFTFTFRLPFPLGVPDGTALFIQMEDVFANQDDIAHFGNKPSVRIRTANLLTGGVEIWPERAAEALDRLYNTRIQDSEYPRLGQGSHFEQWVTVETPGARLRSENSDDLAYAFHRCFHALNRYLISLSLALRGDAVHTVATQDLGRVVLRGYYDQAQTWHYQGPLFMHPEAWPEIVTPTTMEVLDRSIAATIRDLHYGRPFLGTAIWFRRALRASRIRGDYAASVIHLQTAAETMLYDLWRMMHVDRGETSITINRRLAALRNNYKTLATSEIPRMLGGSWDVRLTTQPFGRYWKDVYEVRNRIVHFGGDTGPVEADDALTAFRSFREYISEALWLRHGQYPRTLIAKVGENGLERRSWLTANMQKILTEYSRANIPFYWPIDLRASPPGIHIP